MLGFNQLRAEFCLIKINESFKLKHVFETYFIETRFEIRNFCERQGFEG
jgi:hypothetical protein